MFNQKLSLVNFDDGILVCIWILFMYNLKVVGVFPAIWKDNNDGTFFV